MNDLIVSLHNWLVELRAESAEVSVLVVVIFSIRIVLKRFAISISENASHCLNYGITRTSVPQTSSLLQVNHAIKSAFNHEIYLNSSINTFLPAPPLLSTFAFIISPISSTALWASLRLVEIMKGLLFLGTSSLDQFFRSKVWNALLEGKYPKLR